ncbi:SH3 domain-containing protein [Chloroflexus aggregans]|uniref:SH3 type 3 domain protein n=1 Tax=Chloroflexus aggregans (strain MD-66 / DSM 9485) TaxID=326427 RepID=B8G6F8_CHLAD|nr:SH3 domain-containing protein [Chloroflexus aggregans]ACL23895.1 SH3 type 3 domain protein [Chloroflexus aggregans DSM 9485]
MQTILNQISPPIAIGLIIVGLIIILLVVILIRRRRAAQPGIQLPPALPATSIDYTAVPLEEPQSWQDRLRNLSLAAKILFVLVPILLCMSVGVLVLSLTNRSTAAPPPTPTPSPIPISLTIENATVVRAEPPTINVRVHTTGLLDDTELVVTLYADNQPIKWIDPEQTIRIRNNRGEVRAPKLADGDPTPEGPRYTVVVSLPDGSLSAEAELQIPSRFAAAFYGTVAENPTATSQPTATNTPVAQATPAPTPTPTIAPTPTLVAVQQVAVTNGGNVRKLPFTGVYNVIGGVNAGEQVQIIARTPNALWYYVRTVRDEVGWVSASLLAVTDLIAAETPVANMVTVFVSGPIYLAADPASTQIDRVERNEVVELLERTADGMWYKVLNVREREGWVQASLLGIPDDVAAQVPVAR